jgi:L-threonylcarbamoyladenylate synthase
MEEFIEDIENAIKILKQGGIILYPTDTIWGIGCDATNEKAVDKIYQIKKRADNNSMLILVDSVDRVYQYVNKVPLIAVDIAEIAGRPTTIIYPEAINLPQNIIAQDNSIGIRIAEDKFCQKLIKKLNRPIVSTSANISNQRSPQNFSEISEEIKNAVDYIVKWKQNDKTKAKASSIIKIGISGEVKIIRE